MHGSYINNKTYFLRPQKQSRVLIKSERLHKQYTALLWTCVVAMISCGYIIMNIFFYKLLGKLSCVNRGGLILYYKMYHGVKIITVS